MKEIIDSKKIVTFVPCYEIGSRKFYNSKFYFDEMYINFQLALIEKFSSLTQYDFIIKCLKNFGFSKIIKDWIFSKRYSNILYNDGRLIDSLRKSKKAIVDYPSSAVLECEKARVPTLVLHYDELKIRDTANDSLKYVQLKKFQDINNGIEIVKNFLLEN